MRTITTGAASENGSTSADRASAEGSKSRPIRAAAAIKGLFKDAVKALTRPDDEPKPEARRRSGETEKGFIRTVRRRYDRLRESHRAVARSGTGKAFGAAKEALLDAPIAEDFAAGGGYGGDLFDPASAYWQGNDANNEQWHDDDFGAKQDHYFPQP